MKLVSEIAVDQQTRTRDQTFEGVLDSKKGSKKTICPYLGICTKFDIFLPINWSNFNILNEQNCDKRKIDFTKKPKDFLFFKFFI